MKSYVCPAAINCGRIIELGPLKARIFLHMPDSTQFLQNTAHTFDILKDASSTDFSSCASQISITSMVTSPSIYVLAAASAFAAAFGAAFAVAVCNTSPSFNIDSADVPVNVPTSKMRRGFANRSHFKN